MTNKCDYLVIGAGSISKRHIENIKALSNKAVIGNLSSSGRKIDLEESGAGVIFNNMEEAIAAKPDFVIVASPSPFHIKHALPFIERNIPILIEKPVTDSLSNVEKEKEILFKYKTNIEVAYNLRHSPAMIFFKNLIDSSFLGTMYSIQAEVGQYLADWRPSKNYRDTVSANKNLGGGVLLELSHELDYLTWIFGPFKDVFCSSRQSNHFDIDVEDNIDAIINCSSGVPINLHMDFLQKEVKRTCKVLGKNGELIFDLKENLIFFNSKEKKSNCVYKDESYKTNDMYLNMIKSFTGNKEDPASVSASFDEGLYVVKIIEAMKHSSEENSLVHIDRET